MARTGRPIKTGVDPEVAKAICDNLELAMPVELAAEAEGVSRRTVYDWMEKDPDFFAQVTRARARAAKNLTVRSLKGGAGSHQSMWLLERRYRDGYGNIQRVEHAGHDGGPIKTESAIAAKLDELSVDELRKIAGNG